MVAKGNHWITQPLYKIWGSLRKILCNIDETKNSKEYNSMVLNSFWSVLSVLKLYMLKSNRSKALSILYLSGNFLSDSLNTSWDMGDFIRKIAVSLMLGILPCSREPRMTWRVFACRWLLLSSVLYHYALLLCAPKWRTFVAMRRFNI